MFVLTKFETTSQMVPEFIVPLEITNLGDSITAKLEYIIEAEEDYIMKNFSAFTNKEGVSPEEETGVEDWITNRGFEYNLLNFAEKYPELNDLKKIIGDQYLNYAKELGLNQTVPYIQVWVNILKKDSRYFTKHHHAHPARIGDPTDAYISGNISIRADNTNTYYYSPFIGGLKKPIKNIVGDSILFPSWVFHATDQNKSDKPRLSIAFDIITEEMYNKGKMDNPSNYIPLL
jgi:hypothetical protein